MTDDIELSNKKTNNVELKINSRYKLNNKIVTYLGENDSTTYKFEGDSLIIVDIKECNYEPLYNVNELVIYNSEMFKVKNYDKNYYYTLESNQLPGKNIITFVENLKGVSLDEIILSVKDREPVTTDEELKALVTKTINNHMNSSYCCKCCCDDHSSYNLISSLQAINLNTDSKIIFINRYIKSLVYHENQITQINGIYHSFKFFIQTGSIITPALLSIQHLIKSSQPNYIYWTTWSISLLVGLLSNYISLFGLDKKFFTYEKNYHILVSHGWQYVQLSGKYGKCIDDVLPDHENMFDKFCNNIETLLLNEAVSINNSMKEKSESPPKTPKPNKKHK